MEGMSQSTNNAKKNVIQKLFAYYLKEMSTHQT
jgi:hypothetical protein